VSELAKRQNTQSADFSLSRLFSFQADFYGADLNGSYGTLSGDWVSNRSAEQLYAAIILFLSLSNTTAPKLLSTIDRDGENIPSNTALHTLLCVFSIYVLFFSMQHSQYVPKFRYTYFT
jgi:hypothetical protein